MKPDLNPIVVDLQISGIRRFFNMISGRDNIISLTIGQPDFNTPEHIKEAACRGIENNKTGYTPNAGTLELRQAVAHFMQHKYNLEYDPSNEIIITAGSTQALDIAFRTLLTPGCNVILPGPLYTGYEPLIKLCNATPVLIDTRASGFKYTIDQLRANIDENTRVVVLPFPANPTGAVLSHEELQELAAFLQDQNVFVIADELYSELVFAGDHQSIANYPGMREKTIVINGLSKSHAMTGWRVGILLAPEEITQHILKVHQYNVTCASSVSQQAGLAALTTGLDDALPMRDAYQERVTYTWQRLTDMGLPTNVPKGTFYIFPSIAHLGIPSFELALRLVEEAGVACIPGDAFSSLGEGYLRLSCANSMDNLREGLDRMERFLKNL